MPRLNRSGGLSDWGTIVELKKQRAALVKQNDALVEALKLTLQYAKENADIREIEVMVEAALEAAK